MTDGLSVGWALGHQVDVESTCSVRGGMLWENEVRKGGCGNLEMLIAINIL